VFKSKYSRDTARDKSLDSADHWGPTFFSCTGLHQRSELVHDLLEHSLQTSVGVGNWSDELSVVSYSQSSSQLQPCPTPLELQPDKLFSGGYSPDIGCSRSQSAAVMMCWHPAAPRSRANQENCEGRGGESRFASESVSTISRTTLKIASMRREFEFRNYCGGRRCSLFLKDYHCPSATCELLANSSLQLVSLQFCQSVSAVFPVECVGYGWIYSYSQLHSVAINLVLVSNSQFKTTCAQTPAPCRITVSFTTHLLFLAATSQSHGCSLSRSLAVRYDRCDIHNQFQSVTGTASCGSGGWVSSSQASGGYGQLQSAGQRTAAPIAATKSRLRSVYSYIESDTVRWPQFPVRYSQLRSVTVSCTHLLCTQLRRRHNLELPPRSPSSGLGNHWVVRVARLKIESRRC
jgi:hypothetical protein